MFQAWSQTDLFPDGEMSLRKFLSCLVCGAMSGIVGVLVFKYFVSREGVRNPGPEQIEGNNDEQKIVTKMTKDITGHLKNTRRTFHKEGQCTSLQI